MSAEHDPLLAAIVAARESGADAGIPPELLQAYLRGELDELDQARVRGALARSAALRQELLDLAELDGEAAAQRFAEADAASAPPLPSLRRRPRALPRRLLAWVAVAQLLWLAPLLWQRSQPLALSAEQWSAVPALAEDQFLPLRLRAGDAALPATLSSPRIAVTATLRELYEWEDGLRVRAEVPALALDQVPVQELDGLACFDPVGLRLAMLELPARRHARAELELPADWADTAILIGWWQEAASSYRARALGRWER